MAKNRMDPDADVPWRETPRSPIANCDDSWLFLSGEIREIQSHIQPDGRETQFEVFRRRERETAAYRRTEDAIKIVAGMSNFVRRLRRDDFKDLEHSEHSGEFVSELRKWICGRFDDREEVHFNLSELDRKTVDEFVHGFHSSSIGHAFQMEELPAGWEPMQGRRYPCLPIRGPNDLAAYLGVFSVELKWRLSSEREFDWMYEESKRALRNSRRAISSFGVEPPVEFTFNPTDIYDAENQLDLLGHWASTLLTRHGSDTHHNTESASIGAISTNLPQPVLSPEVSAPLNDILLGILQALDGRVLRVEQLASEVTGGETSRLYKAGLKTVLVERGLVVLDRRIGYFRPDKPPADRLAPR